MAIDNAEKRRSAAGVGFFISGFGVIPNVSKDAEWRAQSGWTYSGILVGAAIPPVVIPAAVGVPRWPLSLHMYETMGGALLYTFPDPQGVVIDDNEHGFLSLTGFQAMRAHEAFWLYDLAPAKWMVLSCGGFSVWEGRLEDRKVERGGFGFTAFGAKRAMDDVLHTGLWTSKSFAGIRPVTLDELAKAAPERWAMDNNNRIWFGLVAGETYNNDDHYGVQVHRNPHNGRALFELDFDYDIDLPTDWDVKLITYAEDFLSPINDWTFTSAGAPATGTVSQTLSVSKPYFTFQVRNNTGGNVTYAGATGANYAKITDIRIKGTITGTVFANEIVEFLVDYVAGFNANTQLSGSLALIQSPNVDLTDEVFEDMRISEILSYLADKGDDQTPPRKWEWGVWENQTVFFRPQGDAALHWYVDADELTLDSTLESLANFDYAIYQDANGRTKRTLTESDDNSYAKYNIFRMGTVSERTTSQTKAELARDTFLNSHKEIAPRASLTLFGLFDAAGARYPLWMARAGDTITIRNLPPTLSTEIDRIRTFRISRKSYNVDTDTLTPVPEYALPTLEIQIANALTFNNASPLGLQTPGTRPFVNPPQPSFS